MTNDQALDDFARLTNLEAEQAVLGAILLRPELLPDVASILTPADWYKDAHRLLYESMLSLCSRGDGLDVVTLQADLRRIEYQQSNAWEWLGGTVTMLNLMDSCVAPSNACHYARLVLDKAICRRVLAQSQQAFELARRGDVSALREQKDSLTFDYLTDYRDPLENINIESVGAFLAKLGDPPPMLIEQLLPQNSFFLIAGKPKHCKSFVALDIADCVCRGVDVFDEYPVNRQGAVIYLAMEDGDFEVGNRTLQRGMKSHDTRPLYFCTERFVISSMESLATLKRKIAHIDPVLLIVDTAAESLGIVKWEDRGEVSEKMRPLREFSREVCSVLLIAHNRKSDGDNGDEIAGTTAFTGAVDGWHSITNKQSLPNGNMLLSIKCDGRGGVRGDVSLEMDTRTLHMKSLTSDETADLKASVENKSREAHRHQRFSDVARAIAQYEGKATIPQIMNYLEWEYQIAHRFVKQMVSEGLLEETGDKANTGAKGKPAPFFRVSDTYKPEDDPFANESPVERPNIQHWMDKDS